MTSSSRRERRGQAKQMGLLSRKESYGQMAERFVRSTRAGDFLHTNYLQELKNSQLEVDTNSTQEDADPGSENINPFEFLGKK